jgi:hypothetical protein
VVLRFQLSEIIGQPGHVFPGLFSLVLRSMRAKQDRAQHIAPLPPGRRPRRLSAQLRPMLRLVTG